MPRRRRTAPPAESPTRLDRQATWSGLRDGDPVDVLDERERGATWTFASFVTNLDTEESWVEVVGGRPPDRRRRSFRPDQLYPYGSLHGGTPTVASLRAAPRLLL